MNGYRQNVCRYVKKLNALRRVEDRSYNFWAMLQLFLFSFSSLKGFMFSLSFPLFFFRSQTP